MNAEVVQLVEDRALFAVTLLALNEDLPKQILEVLNQSDYYVKSIERAKGLLNM